MYCPEEVCVIVDVFESSGLIEAEAENVESPVGDGKAVGVGVSP